MRTRVYPLLAAVIVAWTWSAPVAAHPVGARPVVRSAQVHRAHAQSRLHAHAHVVHHQLQRAHHRAHHRVALRMAMGGPAGQDRRAARFPRG
jgi:hypothetical protein